MATTKLKIRNDLAKKNAGAATTIYVQYCYDGKIKLFNTGKKIEPEYWDDKGQCVKREYRGYTSLNAVINSKRRIVDEIVERAQYDKIKPTLEYVEEKYNELSGEREPNLEKDFYTLYREFIDGLKGVRSKSYIKQHNLLYKHLQAFQKETGYKVSLPSITLTFYDKFMAYLVGKNMATNTVGNHITGLKILLNYLTDRGLNDNLTYKNPKFKRPSAKVEIITLTREELRQVYAFDFTTNPKLERVRDLFVFCCSTGLRFIDLANLKPENIKVDTIEFTTIKTRDRLSIPITPYARQILAKYNNSLPKARENNRMNEHLKDIGIRCGLNEPMQRVKYIGSKRVEITVPKYDLISSHTARRTFVTLSLENGMRPEEVMKITGHKDIKTMMKYVKVTENVAKSAMLRAWDQPAMKVV